MSASIFFLSDYGLRDEWVGVCHAVMRAIAPAASIVDVAHELPPHDVRHAALVLENALPYLATGIVVAVVDPGVGTQRAAVAVRCADGTILVGPDNGLLWRGSQSLGAQEVVELSGSPFRREPVSSTFHGRDLFAPVAAHLAAGAPLAQAGTAIDPATLVRLDVAPPSLDGGGLRAEVRLVDRFGNVQLQARAEDAARAGFDSSARLRAGDALDLVWGRTFADAAPGGAVAYEDSSGWIAVAVHGASAAERLQVLGGSTLTLSRCDR